MAIQNNFPCVGYENLKLEEVFPRYQEKGDKEFDMCLILRNDQSPVRARPESVLLLSDLLVNGDRRLSVVENQLLGQLPFSMVGMVGDIPERVVKEDAKKARYSFYHR